MKNDNKNKIDTSAARAVRPLLMSGATAICLLFSFVNVCMEIKPQETKKGEEQKRQKEKRSEDIQKAVGTQSSLSSSSAPATTSSAAASSNSLAASDQAAPETDILSKLLSLAEEERANVILERDKFGSTPLHRAAASDDNTKVLQILLNILPENKRLRISRMGDNWGNTPLHYAVRTNAQSSLNILLNALPENQRAVALLQQDAFGTTPLSHAARTGNSDLLKIMFDALPEEFRPGVVAAACDDGGNMLLHEVALGLQEEHNERYLKAIRELILQGVNIEQTNKIGEMFCDMLQEMPKEWRAAILEVIKDALTERAALEAKQSVEHKIREPQPASSSAAAPTRSGPTVASAQVVSLLSAERPITATPNATAAQEPALITVIGSLIKDQRPAASSSSSSTAAAAASSAGGGSQR